MNQKVCKRLEELEKISAAAAARRVGTSADYEETIARIRAQAEAWHAKPENQKWLAEQPFLIFRLSVPCFCLRSDTGDCLLIISTCSHPPRCCRRADLLQFFEPLADLLVHAAAPIRSSAISLNVRPSPS